jgi:hypothetical protein
MAFELEDFTRTGSIGRGGALWMYTTDDSDEVVLTANYFNAVYSSLRAGDIITTSSFSHLFFVKVTAVANRVVTHVIDADPSLATNRVDIAQVSDFPAVLDSTKQYFIDGTIDMGTRSLEIPAGGLHIAGFDLGLSVLISTEDNYTMFTSPIGGSGDVFGNDFTMTTSGVNSQVYDIVDSTGFHAIEYSRVNYDDCTSLGTIDSYRQGLEVGSGRFGGTPMLTLKGAWVGGFRITTSIVRGLDSGMSEPLFKAGAGFTMASRFLTDINVDLPASASFADFSPTNFPNPSTLQVQGAIFTRAGVSNSGDTNYFPNITASSVSSAWKENQGLANTFIGGRNTIATEVETVITTAGVFTPLLGTQTASDLQHFTSPVNGRLHNIGNNPREFTVVADKTVVGSSNVEISLRLRKYSAVTTLTTTEYTQTRQVNNLSGGRNVAFFTFIANITLDKDDYLFFEVSNDSSTVNVTAELDSFYIVQER